MYYSTYLDDNIKASAELQHFIQILNSFEYIVLHLLVSVSLFLS